MSATPTLTVKVPASETTLILEYPDVGGAETGGAGATDADGLGVAETDGLGIGVGVGVGVGVRVGVGVGVGITTASGIFLNKFNILSLNCGLVKTTIVAAITKRIKRGKNWMIPL